VLLYDFMEEHHERLRKHEEEVALGGAHGHGHGGGHKDNHGDGHGAAAVPVGKLMALHSVHPEVRSGLEVGVFRGGVQRGRGGGVCGSLTGARGVCARAQQDAKTSAPNAIVAEPSPTWVTAIQEAAPSPAKAASPAPAAELAEGPAGPVPPETEGQSRL
jgi:hypothetical protein